MAHFAQEFLIIHLKCKRDVVCSLERVRDTRLLAFVFLRDAALLFFLLEDVRRASRVSWLLRCSQQYRRKACWLDK